LGGGTRLISVLFNYTGWLAYQGGDRTIILSKNTNSRHSCGYFIRYPPSAIQEFVHNNWHYLLVGVAVLTLIGECKGLSIILVVYNRHS
jgi:hypothetical protein